MTTSPVLWVAGLACALGGAIAGNAVGSSPIADRATVGSFYQSHTIMVTDRPGERALPDHYPLVTRSGVVPVAELSERGLFSQARYRSFVAVAGHAPDIVDDPDSGFEDLDGHPPPAPVMASAAEPPPLAPAAAPVAGHARIIDVQAALAMR